MNFFKLFCVAEIMPTISDSNFIIEICDKIDKLEPWTNETKTLNLYKDAMAVMPRNLQQENRNLYDLRIIWASDVYTALATIRFYYAALCLIWVNPFSILGSYHISMLFLQNSLFICLFTF